MTQYNTLNVKLSNSQLNKLKSGIKNGTEITIKLSSNVVGDSNNENNFPHKLLITNTQVFRLRKPLQIIPSSPHVRLSKTRFHKTRQSGGSLGRLSGPLLKIGLSLMENVLKPLAKSVLIPLGLIAGSSATDTAVYKKMFGSGHPRMLASRPSDLISRMTTLIVSIEETDDVMKIVQSLEESDLLVKSVSKTIKSEAKEQKDRFLRMLLDTLDARLLGNLLIGKDRIRVV